MGRIYTDSLVHDKDALEFLVKIIGESQVMLGTDYPFPLGELDCGNLIQSMETFDGDLKVDTHSFYFIICLLYTSPSPRDQRGSRMPSSA